MKKKLAGTGIISVFIIIIVFANKLLNAKDEQLFSCRAALAQHKDATTLQLSLKFMFKNGYGTLTLAGQARTADESERSINRKIFFTYQPDGEFYPLTSRKIVKYPNDDAPDDWLEQYFPGFYTRVGEELYLSVISQDNGNNIFFIEAIPFFSCKEVDMAGYRS